MNLVGLDRFFILLFLLSTLTSSPSSFLPFSHRFLFGLCLALWVTPVVDQDHIQIQIQDWDQIQEFLRSDFI